MINFSPQYYKIVNGKIIFIKLFMCVTFLLITSDVVWCSYGTYEYAFNQELPGWIALHRIPATWEEAFLRCHFEGATLASPIDNKTTDILHRVMAESNIGKRFFLGTHALFSDGDFFSVEGVPLSNMPIRFRSSGKHGEDEKPKDPEVCLTMEIESRSHYMYTSSCRERYPYICYKKVHNESLKNKCGTFDRHYHLNEHTGSCYKLHLDFHTWSRANMICAAEGGYLVILNDAEEANFVKNMFPHENHDDYWQPMHIGLRAWSPDRVWLTNHGQSVDDVYNAWTPNQPDNHGGKQYCGALIRAGTLDDVWCENRGIFVCEKDPRRIMFELLSN